MDGSTSNNRNSSRKRPAVNPHNNDCTDDPVIGLNVGGRKFYTHQSTLTNGSAYFAAKFSGNFGTESITDEDGRDVYFIDASPDLFEHILHFLRRGIPSWPKKYKEDRVLYERLINEAEYFGVESMLVRLRKSMRPFVCGPDGSGKDILYWLGTHGGRSEYSNPLDIGAVTLGGSCLTKVDKELADPERWNAEDELRTELSNSRREFFQHRPLCGAAALFNRPASDITNNLSLVHGCWYETKCFLLYCDFSYDKLYLDITFQNITIMPTHYSLRFGECCGMSCWDFQASVDGVCWITLHKARNETSIKQPSSAKLVELLSSFQSECLHVLDASTKQSIATSIVEKELRGTWKVEALNNFYKHFRLKGAGEDHSVGCMHGVGFEIYGEVEEE